MGCEIQLSIKTKKGKKTMNKEQVKMIKDLQNFHQDNIKKQTEMSKMFASSMKKAMCNYMGRQVEQDIFNKLTDGETITVDNLHRLINVSIDMVINKIDNEDL